MQVRQRDQRDSKEKVGWGAMNPEQLAEIEQRWVSNEVTMQTINDFNLLLAEAKRLQERLRYEETCHAEAVQEARRLNRMVDLSCKMLGDVPGICLDENGMRKFLESEVAE